MSTCERSLQRRRSRYPEIVTATSATTSSLPGHIPTEQGVLAVKDIRLHIDGAPHDGVGHDFASPEILARFGEAREALSLLSAPVLVRARNRSERLFIAAFDGTGNNKFKDPIHATNVAKIDDAVLSQGLFTDAQVYCRYIQGPGTQDNWLVSTADN